MIPVIAVACAGIAAAVGQRPLPALALGALAAAICGAVRAFAGSSLAASIAAATAALLGVLGLLGVPGFVVARAAFAGAAAMFAMSELVRLTPAKSPYPAIGAALVAAVLDPSFVGLTALSGARLVAGPKWSEPANAGERGPWARPRWAALVPVFGAAVMLLALGAAMAHHGVLSRLWSTWTGSPPLAGTVSQVVIMVGDSLGPMALIACLAGIGVCVARNRFSAAAVITVLVGSLAVAIRDGVLTPGTLVTAALVAGVGIARLAGMVRWQVGQTLTSATASLMLLVAPALALVPH